MFVHRSHSSAKTEQNISGIRQRRHWLFNANNCLRFVAARHRSADNREEVTATESTGTQQDIGRLSNTETVPGDFDNLLEFFVKQN